MDSSKIISLDDFVRKSNRYPPEEEALAWALQLADLISTNNGKFRLLDPKNVYLENDARWTIANPKETDQPSDALFRLGALLHFLITRMPFRISHYLDGPPGIRRWNPQISIRFET